jgi:hypothetical protein
VTTVDNPACGVRAGSRITLLILFGNVPPSCPTVQQPSVDNETVAACAALADGMRAFVHGMGVATPIGSYIERLARAGDDEQDNAAGARPPAGLEWPMRLERG